MLYIVMLHVAMLHVALIHVVMLHVAMLHGEHEDPKSIRSSVIIFTIPQAFCSDLLGEIHPYYSKTETLGLRFFCIIRLCVHMRKL